MAQAVADSGTMFLASCWPLGAHSSSIHLGLQSNVGGSSPLGGDSTPAMPAHSPLCRCLTLIDRYSVSKFYMYFFPCFFQMFFTSHQKLKQQQDYLISGAFTVHQTEYVLELLKKKLCHLDCMFENVYEVSYSVKMSSISYLLMELILLRLPSFFPYKCFIIVNSSYMIFVINKVKKQNTQSINSGKKFSFFFFSLTFFQKIISIPFFHVNLPGKPLLLEWFTRVTSDETANSVHTWGLSWGTEWN